MQSGAIAVFHWDFQYHSSTVFFSKGTEGLAINIHIQCMFFLDGGLSADFLSSFIMEIHVRKE